MGRTRHLSEEADINDDPRYVTALARGLGVLRCFQAQDKWLAHAQIAERTGLPQSTVSRLTFTLTQLGYLAHKPESGLYALSSGVLALGFRMLSNFDIGRIARPAMQAFAERVDAAVAMAVRQGTHAIYTVHCRVGHRLTLNLDIGTQLPLAATAIGRALFCALSDSERVAALRALDAEQDARWPVNKAGLDQALRQFERCGYVTAEREWHTDYAAVAAPLVLIDGSAPLALSVGAPASYLTPAKLESIGPDLIALVASIRTQVHEGAA